jgi:hypothetical protein
MMSDLSAYSECLSLLEAKKLLALMQKPGKGGSWMDWSGEGGSEMNNKIENIASDSVGSLILPDYCTSFSINCCDYICFNRNEMPDQFFLGGGDWMPPEFGDCNELRFYLMPKGFEQAVTLSFSKQTGMR